MNPAVHLGAPGDRGLVRGIDVRPGSRSDHEIPLGIADEGFHHALALGVSGFAEVRPEALYVFDDTCTHMGCSLANGELDGTTLTCACHGSQFDVTSGTVLRGPAQRSVRSRTLRVEGESLLAET